MKKMSAVFILAMALCFFSGSLFAAQNCDLNVRPNLITIGTHYNGRDIAVTGTVPAGCRPVVRMLGECGDKHFKKKGKVFGLVWMNMAKVTLHDIPGVFLIATDTETYAKGGASWERLHLGFSSHKGKIDDFIFGEFLKLKKKEGLYSVQKVGITYGPVNNGMKAFKLALHVPAKLRQGIYQVEVYAVRDGQTCVAHASEDIHVELAGLPAFIDTIAFGHPLLYGIIAVIIAILAGLLMTLLFKEKGGAH